MLEFFSENLYSPWYITSQELWLPLTHWSLGDLVVILKVQFSILFLLLVSLDLIWMSQDLTNDKSTLVQVMAWCRQATRHCLSQCWSRSVSPHGVSPHGVTRLLIFPWTRWPPFHRSYFRMHLADNIFGCICELWGVFCEDFGETWRHYNGTKLYLSKSIYELWKYLDVRKFTCQKVKLPAVIMMRQSIKAH